MCTLIALSQFIKAHGTDFSVGVRLQRGETLLQAKKTPLVIGETGTQVLADSMAIAPPRHLLIIVVVKFTKVRSSGIFFCQPRLVKFRTLINGHLVYITLFTFNHHIHFHQTFWLHRTCEHNCFIHFYYLKTLLLTCHCKPFHNIMTKLTQYK